MSYKIKWRDANGEHETELHGAPPPPGYRCHIVEELAERVYDDSGAEVFREGGELEILEPPALAGKYRIETEYTPFYVSLTNDLLGCYLVFQARDEDTVRVYLAETYRRPNGDWKLPWCAIYDHVPEIDASRAILIPAKCGPLR